MKGGQRLNCIAILMKERVNGMRLIPIVFYNDRNMTEMTLFNELILLCGISKVIQT